MNPIQAHLDKDADRGLFYTEAERIERRALGLPPCEPAPGRFAQENAKRPDARSAQSHQRHDRAQ